MPGQAWNMWEAKSRKKASPPSFDPAALLSGGGGGGAKIVKWPERKRVRQKIHGGKERKEAEGERAFLILYILREKRRTRERPRLDNGEKEEEERRGVFRCSTPSRGALLFFASSPLRAKKEEKRRAAHLTCFF